MKNRFFGRSVDRLRFVLWFFIFLMSGSSVFAAALNESSESTRSNEFAVFGAMGSGVLFEKGNDSISEVRRLPLSGAFGIAWAPFRARIEYSSFRTADGNSTISVAREVESVFSWLSYDPQFGEWSPVAGLGIGVLRTNVETKLNQTTELSRGPWRAGFSLALGFQAAWTNRLMVRPELRFDSAEDFKTKDARWGAFINLEISVF